MVMSIFYLSNKFEQKRPGDVALPHDHQRKLAPRAQSLRVVAAQDDVVDVSSCLTPKR